MTKPKLVFLHVCDNAFFSKDNKLNVIGIFDNVTTNGPLAMLPKFSIAFGLLGEITGSISLEVISPAGKTIINAPIFKPLDTTKLKTNLVLNLINITFQEFGSYKILIKTNGELIEQGQFYFTVSHA